MYKRQVPKDPLESGVRKGLSAPKGRRGRPGDVYKRQILEGASWHRPDQYYLLLDLIPYCETRLRLNRDARDRRAFAKKCLLNIANAGQFSSDRTIRQYAREIWGV